jgi:hypothetical protein
MVIVAAEPAEVRQLLIISSPVPAASQLPIFSIICGSSIELVLRGVPKNVPCENLRGNAHNNKDGEVLAEHPLVGSGPSGVGQISACQLVA